MKITGQEVDFERIRHFSNTGMPLEKIIMQHIEDWNYSEKRKMMIRGEDYYLGDNLDIDSKNRWYLDENGNKVIDNEHRRNSKLEHNHVRKLVDQKISYLLSNGVKVSSEDDVYEEAIQPYFDKEFNKRFKDTASDAINKGIAWWQAYYRKGKLKFKSIPSEEVIPLWGNAEHSSLDAIIRVYDIEVYEGNNQRIVRKVEYYDGDGVKFFVVENNKLIPDATKKDRNHNVEITTRNKKTKEIIDVKKLNWDKVPFIYYKYNRNEKPLLAFIKSLADDYDWNRSEFADVLADVLQGITIVEGYGQDELADIVAKIFRHRAARVEVGGDVRTLTVDINTEAAKFHQEQTKNAIYEAGRGVDIDIDTFGNAPSGIALEILYSDLDMDMDMFATELEASLDYLMYFINVDIVNNQYNNNKYKLEELEKMNVEYIFEKTVLVNKKEVVESLENSSLSQQTKVERHPYAADDELERLEKEEEENILNGMFNFEENLGKNLGDIDE